MDTLALKLYMGTVLLFLNAVGNATSASAAALPGSNSFISIAADDAFACR